MKKDRGAIAVDLGASSARFAAGWLENGRIRVEVIKQVGHSPRLESGREVWDVEALTRVCEEASEYGADQFEECTIGIDSWGVDFGFLDSSGAAVAPVVCYREASHARVFEAMRECRAELFRLTGIQHQPFNTIYQLIARRGYGDDVNREWVFLPSWLMRRIGSDCDNDLTMASTSQLLMADASGWCERAFEIAGVERLRKGPVLPGERVGRTKEGVEIVQIGGHDTACAVYGLGPLAADQAFVSLGTWSLLGCLEEGPVLTKEAEHAGFSNERAIDGKVRFLTNVAGFYVVNRLHQELRVEVPIGDWIARATKVEETVDLRDQKFFNPKTMAGAIRESVDRVPETLEEWAGVGIRSIARTNADQLRSLEKIVGRSFSSIRACGGPSNSDTFCRLLAEETGKTVIAGPQEATLLGNLAQQLGADGATIQGSFVKRVYRPRD